MKLTHDIRFKWSLLLVIVLVAVFGVSGHALANPQPGLPAAPHDLDRTTPRRVVEAFLQASGKADFDRAAYLLDLRRLPKNQQATEGPELARKLRYVLDRALPLDPLDYSDEPTGNPADGLLKEQLGEIALSSKRVKISLQLVPISAGDAVWVVSRNTVKTIPELYEAYGPSWIAEQLPDWAHHRPAFGLAIWQLIAVGGVLVTATLGGFLVASMLLWLGGRIAKNTETEWDDAIIGKSRGPLRAFAALLLARLLSDHLGLAAEGLATLERVLGTVAMVTAGWFITRIVHGVTDVIAARHAKLHTDPTLAHGTVTRIRAVRQVVNAVILVVTVSLALTQFEVVRKVGLSLLAAGSIVGVIVGFAAQKSLANLLAGLQISMAQPLQIGDRVRIAGELGWIEEISLTYVVLKTIDLRRLVLPITDIVEKPFENWTKTSSQMFGDVLLHADYRVPVELVRQRATELCQSDEDWDGELVELLVVEATDKSVVLRLRVSAADAAKAWALRCRLRERLVDYLQKLEDGRFLPVVRAEIEPHHDAA